MNFFFLLSIFFSLFILSELNKEIDNNENRKYNNNDQIIFKNALETINSFLENKIIRKLEGENGGGDDNNNTNNKDIKNDNTTYINNNKKNPNENNENKSSIGWIGIIIIIILSIVVVYVIFVGFRYYRRKKYQNPSFYYKITEEMFDDITPIE